MEKHNVKVSVEGGDLVALGNACPYNPDGFTKDETFTYYGEALAIVRVTDDKKVTLKATYEGKEEKVEFLVCYMNLFIFY